MAKKRRKPSTRARTPAPARSSVRTAEGRGGTAESEPRGRTGPTTPSRGHAPSPATPLQRTRTEKKELARRQREDIRRRVRRAERARQLAWIGGLTVVIAAAIFFFTRPDEPTTRPDILPGELTTEAPWPANIGELGDRLDVLGLPASGSAMHEHANVQILVRGEQVSVPVNIGVSDVHASLHTHTDDGVVHLESGTVREFTLGEFFDVWGVRLSETCIGAYCVEGDATLRVFKDGESVSGPIRDVVLDAESVIVLAYGTPDELPDPIPSSFDFSTVQP